MGNTSTTTVTIEELMKENSLLKQEIEELKAKLRWFEEQFCLSRQKMYGRSSEKTNFREGEQLSFFNEAEKEGLDYCNKLFAIERELRDVTPEERYEERLKRSKPILDEFYSYLKYHMPRVLPKSVLGGAIRYCLNQWDKLTAFLLDGRLEIDNNISERSIKPFVIGRKNWLFSNTPKGARASATIYSIVETAKENGLNPFEYLKYLFEKLPNIDIEDKEKLDEVLPWSTTLPSCCRVK
jgi:regulator of replication initiation timing